MVLGKHMVCICSPSSLAITWRRGRHVRQTKHTLQPLAPLGLLVSLSICQPYNATMSYNFKTFLPLGERGSEAKRLQDFNSTKSSIFLPKRLATRFSKKVFGWLYSFSLIILMILTAAFLIVTPLETILQTWPTNFMGIKLLIIFSCLALFFISSLILYFSRLIQSRVQTNQIPSKSVYMPLEKGDLPHDVLTYIDANLRKCLTETKVLAGPLYNREETFEYPGKSPPEYIRNRNIALDLPSDPHTLPSDCVFDEIISSIGLKLKTEGLLCGNFRFPKNYTFREIIMALAQELLREDNSNEEVVRASKTLIRLYEKFKFGPQLIKGRELAEFLVELENFVLLFVNYKGGDPLMDDISNHLNLRRVSSIFAYSGSMFGAGRVPSRSSSLVNPFDIDGALLVQQPDLSGHANAMQSTGNSVPPVIRYYSRGNSSLESVRRNSYRDQWSLHAPNLITSIEDDPDYLRTIR